MKVDEGKELSADTLEFRRPALVSEWQPIETAPRDNKTRLLGYPVHGQVGEVYWLQEKNRSSWVASTGGFFVHPTHWMPLPDPPKETL